MGKGPNRSIRDLLTTDETDPFEFGEAGECEHGIITQMGTAGEIDVAYARTVFCQVDDCLIRDLLT
jgi:hypothetical protein